MTIEVRPALQAALELMVPLRKSHSPTTLRVPLLSQTRVQAARTVTLLGVIDPGWQVRQALNLGVERDSDGSFVISDDIFLVYGVGASFEEALRDYCVSLIEYYEMLVSRLDGNPFNRGPFEHLVYYLQPLSAG